MNPWPRHPAIYEINTWVWINELSRKCEKSVTLAAVPSEEWDYLSSLGADLEKNAVDTPDSRYYPISNYLRNR